MVFASNNLLLHDNRRLFLALDVLHLQENFPILVLVLLLVIVVVANEEFLTAVELLLLEDLRVSRVDLHIGVHNVVISIHVHWRVVTHHIILVIGRV